MSNPDLCSIGRRAGPGPAEKAEPGTAPHRRGRPPAPGGRPLRFLRDLRAPRAALPAADAGALRALGAWAADQAKALGALAQERDADGPMLDRALGLVLGFIQRRGLVVFGGQAIDWALRLQGAAIYADTQRPDYDCLSPRAVDDARDLAEELARAGFEGVGAIRAVHVQTTRVFVDFWPVADFGYAPPAVFERIPTLEYRGVRVVHPDYQRMDLHLAFCFPLRDAPREVVFHRWRRDLERLRLFDLHYPLGPEPAVPGPKPAKRGGARAATGAPGPPVRLGLPVACPVGGAESLEVALHGFAAYAVLREGLGPLAAALGLPAPEVAAPRLALVLPAADALAVELPAWAPQVVRVASPEPVRAAGAAAAQGRWRDPYMDAAPATLELPPAAGAPGLAIASTRGELLAASVAAVEAGGAAAEVRVVTPPFLLLHFLCEALRTGEGRYREYYGHVCELVRAAEALCAAALERPGGPPGAAPLDVLAASPFARTVRTLGRANLSPALELRLAQCAEQVGDPPPEPLTFEPGAAAGLPPNYYPATSRRAPFDYGACAFYRRAGELREV